MQDQHTTTKSKSSRSSSSQGNKRRQITLLNSEWDAQYNPIPVLKAPRGWNKDYPDVERLFTFH